MKYSISKPNKILEGCIKLPASKSISNRVQIINALSNNFESLKNLSHCEDSKTMQKILSSDNCIFDVGHSGTSMRFLTAYLSKIVGEWILTGSERMKQRPIGVLVDALNSIGAQISYIEKKNYPPLKILGSNLTGSEVEIQGDVSSQYISALLLIAPRLENGLRIKLKGEVISKSYLEMTRKVMEEFGVKSKFTGCEIFVAKQDYQKIPYTIEGDWSGASYWWSFMALAQEGKILLQGLKKHSIQADSRLVAWFEKLGVKTQFSKKGIIITKQACNCKKLVVDFTQMPDLAQTFTVCSSLKNIPFHFSGLKTLKIKETNRIVALIKELGKLGYVLHEPNEGELLWNGERKKEDSAPLIETYQDHRMAMAFAPIAICKKNVNIHNPDVVKKSYPYFWDHVKNLGFSIVEL